MRILVHDPYLDAADADGVEWVDSLPDLLGRSDFVSVHARATAENSRLFDAAAFSAMKPGSYFLNTARETLVDEHALADALASGHLAGRRSTSSSPRRRPARTRCCATRTSS